MEKDIALLKQYLQIYQHTLLKLRIELQSGNIWNVTV